MPSWEMVSAREYLIRLLEKGFSKCSVWNGFWSVGRLSPGGEVLQSAVGEEENGRMWKCSFSREWERTAPMMRPEDTMGRNSPRMLLVEVRASKPRLLRLGAFICLSVFLVWVWMLVYISAPLQFRCAGILQVCVRDQDAFTQTGQDIDKCFESAKTSSFQVVTCQLHRWE